MYYVSNIISYGTRATGPQPASACMFHSMRFVDSVIIFHIKCIVWLYNSSRPRTRATGPRPDGFTSAPPVGRPSCGHPLF